MLFLATAHSNELPAKKPASATACLTFYPHADLLPQSAKAVIHPVQLHITLITRHTVQSSFNNFRS
jgi:hypothetical protein